MDKPWGNKHQNILVIEKFPAVGNRNHGISLDHFLLNLWGKSMLQLFKSKMTETGYLLTSLKYGKCYLIFKKVLGKFPLSGDPSLNLSLDSLCCLQFISSATLPKMNIAAEYFEKFCSVAA